MFSFLITIAPISSFANDGKGKINSDVKKLHLQNNLSTIDYYPNLEELTINCVNEVTHSEVEVTYLPESLGNLTKLKMLKLDNGNGCSMTVVLPNSIANLQKLEILDLSGATHNPNNMKSYEPFPESIKQLKSLKSLSLTNMGTVPDFIRNLKNLENLSIRYSDLKDLPEWLNEMPKLKNIALGDNCYISNTGFGSEERKNKLQKRFPNIKLALDNEYDCPQDLSYPQTN
jgi:Leucine-rich repeat (LRR) protein